MCVRRFHYILLVIEPDTGIVEVMDSKSKPLEAWGDMADILLKAWIRFTNKSPGLKNKELRIKQVPVSNTGYAAHLFDDSSFNTIIIILDYIYILF
jgi:hypothetical protein